MKLRQQRKRIQKRIRHNNAWNWSFDKFTRAVVKVYYPLSKAMEEAYMNSRKVA